MSTGHPRLPLTEVFKVNPCSGLPLAAHEVVTFLQRKHQRGRPFVLDLSAVSVATRIERENVRDAIADLHDFGFIQYLEDRVTLVGECSCPVARTQSTTTTTRKQPRSFRLSERFHNAVALLDVMGIGNNSALAKNIASWIRDGLDEEMVILMIDEFADNFRKYCPKGAPPWKAFVGRRHQILQTVKDRWMDQHQWDDDFDVKCAALFGGRERQRA